MSRSAEEQRPLVDGDGDACSTPEPVVPKLVTFVLACSCAVDSADVPPGSVRFGQHSLGVKLTSVHFGKRLPP